jgi:hypothetical protein
MSKIELYSTQESVTSTDGSPQPIVDAVDDNACHLVIEVTVQVDIGKLMRLAMNRVQVKEPTDDEVQHALQILKRLRGLLSQTRDTTSRFLHMLNEHAEGHKEARIVAAVKELSSHFNVTEYAEKAKAQAKLDAWERHVEKHACRDMDKGLAALRRDKSKKMHLFTYVCMRTIYEILGAGESWPGDKPVAQRARELFPELAAEVGHHQFPKNVKQSAWSNGKFSEGGTYDKVLCEMAVARIVDGPLFKALDGGEPSSQSRAPPTGGKMKIEDTGHGSWRAFCVHIVRGKPKHEWTAKMLNGGMKLPGEQAESAGFVNKIKTSQKEEYDANKRVDGVTFEGCPDLYWIPAEIRSVKSQKAAAVAYYPDAPREFRADIEKWYKNQ